MSLADNRLRLFGITELNYRGHAIDLARARLDELVAYLAVRPGVTCPRSQIAYAMWADSSEKQARTNLRNLIFNLKKTWPSIESAIAIERSALRWRSDADIIVDIHRFQSLLDEAERALTGEDSVRLLAEAASLYRGDLLPNCYEEWAMAARQRLHENCASALAQLVDRLLDLRRHDEALTWAKQLQAHDPLRESSYRRLMLSYLALHDRSAALRVYHVCADMLQKELGVEPSLATRQIVDRLLGQEIPASQPDDGPSPSVPRPHLVGRRSEWQALLDQWRQAEAGRACIVAIQGESGIGKTRLAEELIDWVGRQGYSWASSRSYAAHGAIAYAPVAAWLRSPRVNVALEAIEDLWRVEVHRLLPELAAQRPDLPPPGSISEDWQRQRFYQAIVQTLQSCPAPVLLHLDDMQWSDPETLSFLHYLLQSLPQHPLLVVGCVRTEEMEPNDALVRLRHDLLHSEQWVELSLGPLSAADSRILAKQTAGTNIDDEAADALYANSEGHPLLLIETIHADGPRSSTATGAVNGEQNGRRIDQEVRGMPVKIFAMMAHRLDQLSAPARELAEVAAVIGRDFSFELLLRVGAVSEDAVVEALDELWRRRIVRHQHEADYDFSHDRLREAAYAQISPPRRRHLHGRAARAMEVLYQDQLDQYAGQIARHYERNGELALACAYYGRAAAFAVQQYALSSAEELYETALGMSDSVQESEKLELLQAQADLFQQTGKEPKVWSANLAEQDLIAKSNPAISRRALIRVFLHQASYFQAADEYTKSIRAAESAIQLAQVENDYDGLARAHLVAGNACHATEVVTARQHFLDAAHFAGLIGNRALEARSLDDATITGMFTGVPYSQLLQYLNQAFALARGLDDRLILTNLYNKLGIGPVLQGMSGAEEAEENLQRALSMARETGVRYTEKLVLGNLGLLYAHRGDYRMAVKHLQIAREIVDVGYSALRDGYLQHNLGLTYTFQGRVGPAYQLLSDILDLLQRAKHVLGELRARSDLGYVLFLMGDHESSHNQVSAVLETARRLGDIRQEALDSVRLGYLEE
ncbi:MAG: ATP-binding protein, partial [Caldilineaceae bacterium]